MKNDEQSLKQCNSNDYLNEKWFGEKIEKNKFDPKYKMNIIITNIVTKSFIKIQSC